MDMLRGSYPLKPLVYAFICYLMPTCCGGVRPNFIIMLMDDMGWGDLGVNGEPSRETPRLDRMAAEGMLLTDFYSANPLCSPCKRTSVVVCTDLSGKEPHRQLGQLSLQGDFQFVMGFTQTVHTPEMIIMGGIQPEERLISEVLRSSGYRTKLVGKWHLGHHKEYLPLQHGFDEWFGAPNCHFGPYNDKDTPNIPVYRDNHMIGRYYEDFKIDLKTGESNLTQMYTEEAVRFLHASAGDERPFFLYWAPDATHAPVYASSKFLHTSRRGRYGDAVRELDWGVGKILDTLKSLGLANNTLVFFSSDNGAALFSKIRGGSNGPFLCGKETTFEGGIREPAIAWWPGQITEGSISHQVASLMDLFPTLVELSGAQTVLPPTDGVSLTPVLLRGKQFQRALFHYRGDELMAVRTGIYKAHRWTWSNSWKEFYKGVDFCRGEDVINVTTHDQVNHSVAPLLFHLGRDPGEKYPIRRGSAEYRRVIPGILKMIHKHRSTLVPGKPQLNWCDDAAMNWSPPGCDVIGRCLATPPSAPYRCDWPH